MPSERRTDISALCSCAEMLHLGINVLITCALGMALGRSCVRLGVKERFWPRGRWAWHGTGSTGTQLAAIGFGWSHVEQGVGLHDPVSLFCLGMFCGSVIQRPSGLVLFPQPLSHPRCHSRHPCSQPEGHCEGRQVEDSMN